MCTSEGPSARQHAGGRPFSFTARRTDTLRAVWGFGVQGLGACSVGFGIQGLGFFSVLGFRDWGVVVCVWVLGFQDFGVYSVNPGFRVWRLVVTLRWP